MLSDPARIRASCFKAQQNPEVGCHLSTWDYVHIPEPGRKISAPDDSNMDNMPSHKPCEPKVGEEESKHRKLRCWYKNDGLWSGMHDRSLLESLLPFLIPKVYVHS